MIGLSVPYIYGDEREFVQDAFEKNEIAIGSYLGYFKQEILNFTKAEGCVLTSSGTAALHLSLIALGVRPNDEVIAPTLTFIATINAIKYVNASPIFFDCDNYSNIDILQVKKFILEDTFFKDGYSYNKKTKNRVSAILIVHVWGNANDFTEILSLCRERNIRILEDASESLGSFTNDAHTGLIGDLGVFSFNGNKIITTGGGGCILSNNSSLLEKVEYLSQQSKDDPINFIHNEIGFNYRMSNISAAIGYGQILHIDEILIKKKLLRDKYDYIVSKTKDLILRPIPERGTHNCWLNLITFNKKVDLIKITHQLDEDGIQVRPVWQLCHLQRYLTEYQVPYPIVNAKKIRESSLCLPSSYDLELDLIELILQKVSKYAKD